MPLFLIENNSEGALSDMSPYKSGGGKAKENKASLDVARVNATQHAHGTWWIMGLDANSNSKADLLFGSGPMCLPLRGQHGTL